MEWADIYKHNEIFKKNMNQVDYEAINLIGYSVKDIIYDASKTLSEPFDSLVETSIGIFMFEYAAAQMLIEANVLPDIVLGSSMGEIVSLVIAGVLDMKEAVKLLIVQAQRISGYAPRGSMICIFANEAIYKSRKDLFAQCELVTVSHDLSFVVAANQAYSKELINKLR